MKIKWIRIESIEPNQRCLCAADSIEHLADSIRQRGQVEPIKIYFAGEGFRIMDGEKRWRACKKLGLSQVKAVIVEVEG